MDKVWVLSETEYEGQCTGFSDQTRWLCIFTKKPSVMEVAPLISKHLSGDMGEAIAQVQSLVHQGSISVNNGWYDVQLEQVPLNKKLGDD